MEVHSGFTALFRFYQRRLSTIPALRGCKPQWQRALRAGGPMGQMAASTFLKFPVQISRSESDRQPKKCGPRAGLCSEVGGYMSGSRSLAYPPASAARPGLVGWLRLASSPGVIVTVPIPNASLLRRLPTARSGDRPRATYSRPRLSVRPRHYRHYGFARSAEGWALWVVGRLPYLPKVTGGTR